MLAGRTQSYLIDEYYETGIKVSDAEMTMINLANHDTLSRWNYTLRPAENVNWFLTRRLPPEGHTIIAIVAMSSVCENGFSTNL